MYMGGLSDLCVFPKGDYTSRYMAAASALPAFSWTESTSTDSVRSPKRRAITSPTFTS